MESFKWKVRISLLWVVYAVGWAGYLILDLIRPGVIDEAMARGISQHESARNTSKAELICHTTKKYNPI